jgi:hypothetical protein
MSVDWIRETVASRAFEWQIKQKLWERMNFAIRVLRGEWNAMKVEELADHLSEVLAEAREDERKFLASK